LVQQNSIDEAWLDLTGCQKLLGSPMEIAQSIMGSIQKELDLWCSIGISENKFLAKMASEMKKPLGITELYIEDIKEKLWPLSVGEMYGIGKQTEKKLNELAIYKIGDIAKAGAPILKNSFGKYGEELFRLANGIDNSPVVHDPMYDNKSISRSTTLSFDTRDVEYLKTILLKLSEEVGYDARKQECKGKTVSIIIKYSDFTSITRQKSVKPTYLTKDIYEIGVQLLEENMGRGKNIRLIGIGLTNFPEETAEQISMFELMGEPSSSGREEAIEKTMDKIRERFGTKKIIRASMLENKKGM
jgi:DNA polymerase-4